MENKLKFIISGGGTGGHIFPAIAIANAIKEKLPEADILFVGAKGRMEMEKVPAAGYEIKGIPARGLKRPLYSLSNIAVIIDYIKCKNIAKKIIKDFKPNMVIGVGGYASAAIVNVASKMHIPVLLQEQNSYAGIVNKKNGAAANKICVAYEGMERFFNKEKLILTGNPVRKEIKFCNSELKEEGRKFYKLDANKKTIFVVGGSLGCRTLNNCIKNEIENGDLFKEYQLIWQCGNVYKDQIDSFMKDRNEPNIYYSNFIQRMDLAYAAADIVISRAGAGTISELCIAGKCTIFVPSPNVAEDHQTHNAMALVKSNAALIVKDKDAEKELMETIENLIKDQEKITELETNILKLAKNDAANVIADECIKLAQQKQ